ncbi:HNH/ENDO VII family nuclease [Gracilibacillus thailandensis]|nr:HNH/ENDO VII family nuclease [Gracilibacillus thailandensis]
MSNLRISIKEVKQFYEQVQRQTATVTESIDLVEKQVDELIHMDQFQGEAADATKEYFQVLHKNLLQAFRGLFEQIEINISRHLQDFHEEVDSNHHAIIHQIYLDEKETDIHQSFKRIQQIETDVSQIISSISDLSSARAPTAANVLDDSEASLQVMKQLSQRMEAYSNGFKSDQSQIESAIQEINSLMGKVINNNGRTQLKTNFETQLPGIRSYVKASMETSAMQRILSPLHNKMEENTIVSRYNRTREHALGLQQYMNNSLIDKQKSQHIQQYMNLRLSRTIQQANTWWSQTLMYQTSKVKWQLGYLSLFNRQDKSSQVQNKMDKLQAEDIATVQMSDEEVAAIQNYLKEIESGEVKPNKDWNVSQFENPELTFEDKRKVLGGMGTGTPDGLAGPSTATFKFFTEDIATIIDPNAGMGDKAMASLFTFVKPAKFLDTMGDVAGPGLKKFGNDGKGKEYKNYKSVEYNGTTKINGEVRDISRRVYQRIDIDYERIDPKTGKTNYQLMKSGRPPVWSDGTKIELHHIIQREPGSMVELPNSMHKEYDRILHGLVENGGSFRNDPVLKKQYENFRSKYWRWRAKQIDKGEL